MRMMWGLSEKVKMDSTGGRINLNEGEGKEREAEADFWLAYVPEGRFSNRDRRVP